MKTDLTNIKNIIFDLGKVLLNLDFEASINAFKELGSDGEVLDHKNAYANPVFYQLEIGIVTPNEFRVKVREMLKNPNVTDEQIDKAWNAMICDIPKERVSKLKELGKNYNIFLYSNTNKIHIDKLLIEFEEEHGINFSSLFKSTYYSHEINDRKPEISSFKKVIELAGVTPKETLFVDDLEKNILGAQKVGLETLWLKEGMEMTKLF